MALVAAQDFAGAATLQMTMKLQSVGDVVAGARADAALEVDELVAKGDYAGAVALKAMIDERASAPPSKHPKQASVDQMVDGMQGSMTPRAKDNEVLLKDLVAKGDYAGAASLKAKMETAEASLGDWRAGSTAGLRRCSCVKS